MIRTICWWIFGDTRIWRWKWLNRTLHGTRADDIWAQADKTFKEAEKVFKMVPEGKTELRRGNRLLRIFKRTR